MTFSTAITASVGMIKCHMIFSFGESPARRSSKNGGFHGFHLVRLGGQVKHFKVLLYSQRFLLSFSLSSISPKTMAILAVGSSISPTPYFSASQSTRIKHPTRITKHFGLFRSRIVSLSSPLPDSQRPPTTSQGHGENVSPPHSLPAKSIGDTPSSPGPKFGTYAVANPNGNPAARLSQSAESSIERVK